mmetsp:Transcript_28195/g.55026  ORF Transcript_28195/g.55026 Transcript_28195/m.55026 type:complete len:84 (+) Transcript_28195:74-325(+)
MQPSGRRKAKLERNCTTGCTLQWSKLTNKLPFHSIAWTLLADGKPCKKAIKVHASLEVMGMRSLDSMYGVHIKPSTMCAAHAA